MKTNNLAIIEATVSFVKNKFAKEGSGHDWHHIERVTNLARTIAKQEKADEFICTITALLHDVIDDKLCEDVQAAEKELIGWLKSHSIPKKEIEHILSIINNMSFKGGSSGPLSTIEGQVVQDADRLDAIGAIGIARCFQYSGFKGQLIYDPEILPRNEMTKDQYRNEVSTAINHFYEKLLKLKELMNTEYGRHLAEERHQFMEIYLTQFYQEWNGEK